MRLILPLPPNAANSRRHWRVALKEKKAYWAELNLLLMAGRIQGGVVAPDVSRITVTLYLWSPMDQDNAMARLKPLLDWLKDWGYIKDDAPRHLKWAGLPEQVIDRKRPRVELTLEPAA